MTSVKPTSCGTGRGRPALLVRAIVSLVLVSGVAAAVLTAVPTVNGASTTSSSASTTINFVVTSDKPSYTGSATIFVTGIAPSTATAVTITISNPRHASLGSTPAAVRQDDSFNASFQAGGPSWNVSGTYTIVAIVQQQDTIAPPPTTNSTFVYTATNVVSTSESSSASTTPSGSADTSSLTSVIGIVAVIVVAVALVGFMLRSRGRTRPATVANPAGSQPPKTQQL